MNLIQRCPNGHRVKVAPHHLGHRVRCPKCQAIFTVPAPSKRELTESSVLRILGEYSPQEAQRQAAEREAPFRWSGEPPAMRTCPRCRNEIDAQLHICPHCWVYLPDLPQAAAG
jgi:hypothetical protein